MNGCQEFLMLEDVPVANPITLTEKRCSKCRTLKLLLEFNKRSKSKDNRSYWCKRCVHEYKVLYRLTHKEQISEQKHKWYLANIEKVKNASAIRKIIQRERVKTIEKRWRDEHKDSQRERHRQWYIKNKINILKKNKEWYAKNKKEWIAHTKKWALKNPDKVKLYQKRANIKRTDTPRKRLNMAISRRINKTLHGLKAGHHWEILVGYTAEQLIEHLEKQFTFNIKWGNYGSYWHVDHIIPLSAFYYKDSHDHDFKECWALKNLRPLEAKENLKKGVRLDKINY